MSELYLFEDGINTVGYTSGVFNKLFEGNVYIPAKVKRNDIQLTDNPQKNVVALTFGQNTPYIKYLFANQAEHRVICTIYRDNVQLWTGIVGGISATNTEFTVALDTSSNSIRRRTNGQQLSLQCWKVFGDVNCGLDATTFNVSFTGMNISSGIFTVSGLSAPDNTYSNGSAFINGQQRRIISQIGTNIVLAEAFLGTQTGTLTLQPTCTLTQDNCESFGNLDRFGGFAYIPTYNPMNRVGLLAS